MNTSIIISIITIVVTFICGLIAKKIKWFNNKLIPIQNLLIGLLVAAVEWFITKDFNTAIALSGLIAGGAYDIVNNLKKITKGSETS